MPLTSRCPSSLLALLDFRKLTGDVAEISHSFFVDSCKVARYRRGAAEMSHSQSSSQYHPSSMRAFVACSAFELLAGVVGLGATVAALVAFLNIHGRACVVAVRDRLSVPWCASRGSPCWSTRPTEPGLRAELSRRKARKRRPPACSGKGDRVSYDFAFFTHSDILLEVEDALTADGITAALQLLCVTDATPLRPRCRTRGSGSCKTGLCRCPSAGCSSADFVDACAVIQRGGPRGEVLRRIRMHEAISCVPPRSSYATSPRNEGRWATRPLSRGLSFLRHAQTYGRCLATSPQARWRRGGPASATHGSHLAHSVAQFPAGARRRQPLRCRGLLHLLEKEKRRNVLFESQGRCIRALRLMEEANAPSLRASR
ncbi:hypothetical protein TcBrA4_0018200 [Trypanosoma cruzi]|nr:hypothetical protein TcBrA4_0018200 [Trypanosoma cruzi]